MGYEQCLSVHGIYGFSVCVLLATTEAAAGKSSDLIYSLKKVGFSIFLFCVLSVCVCGTVWGVFWGKKKVMTLLRCSAVLPLVAVLFFFFATLSALRFHSPLWCLFPPFLFPFIPRKRRSRTKGHKRDPLLLSLSCFCPFFFSNFEYFLSIFVRSLSYLFSFFFSLSVCLCVWLMLWSPTS